MASPADDICPHDVAEGQWRFTDGTVWKKDRKLTVKCLEKLEDSEENKNEVNGKFKIMNLKWDDRLRNPKSLKYKTLANTIEGDIMTMLTEKDELSHQADFTVSVERFKKGSVVVNFKVDYILKHAVLAVPFILKPDNITDTLAKDFQYQNGILFSRFAIAANSFNGTVFRDQCSVRGCSHKCSYDYDEEDYLCTCPRTLQLSSDNKTCDQPALGLPPASNTGETVPLPNITTERQGGLLIISQQNKEEPTVAARTVSITEQYDDGTTNSIEDEITDITSPPPPSITTTSADLQQQNTQLPVLTSGSTLTEETTEAINDIVTTIKVTTETAKDTTVTIEGVTRTESTTIVPTETTKDTTEALSNDETSKDSTEPSLPPTTTSQSSSSEILEIMSQINEDEDPETTPRSVEKTTTTDLTEIEATTYSVVELGDEVEEIEEDQLEGEIEEKKDEEEKMKEEDDEDEDALEITTENLSIKDKETTADLTLTTVQPTTTDNEGEQGLGSIFNVASFFLP